MAGARLAAVTAVRAIASLAAGTVRYSGDPRLLDRFVEIFTIRPDAP